MPTPPRPSAGWLLRLDVGLAWLAALAALVLVPADVAAALAHRPPGPLAACWRAAYWWGPHVAGRGRREGRQEGHDVACRPLTCQASTQPPPCTAKRRSPHPYVPPCLRRYGFLAQVLVLPLHMEFTRSGEFTVRDRLLAAARWAPCAGAGL